MEAPECPGCRALDARSAELEDLLQLEGLVRDLQD
jgi:hypothetical protein